MSSTHPAESGGRRWVHLDDEPLRLQAPKWVHLLLVLSSLITLAAAGYIHVGGLVTGFVVSAGVVALLGWRATTYNNPASRRVLPWYIATVIVLLLHYGEAWYFGYAEALTARFPGAFASPVVFNDVIYLSIFPLAGTALYLWAAVGVFFHHPLGNYMAWFVFVLALAEGLAPFILPLFGSGGYEYFPGMATAPVAALFGGRGVRSLVERQTEGI